MSEQNKENSTSQQQQSNKGDSSVPSQDQSNPQEIPNNQTEKSPLELAQQEAQKWKNDYLYLRAEFDNFRKHSIKERSDLIKYGAERFLHDFLDIMDNLERALMTKPTPQNISDYVTGVQMIAKEIKSVLLKHGVTSEECYGMPFDPSKHEALGTESTADVPAGHIAKVVRAPYKLHDKLLRPAQVLVAAEVKHQN